MLDYADQQLPDHLGGHLNKTHNDRGVLSYLIERYSPKTFLDIGCGPGGMVELALNRGLDAYGVDGDFTLTFPNEIQNRIYVHDFTHGIPAIPGEFDIGYSVEFVEHVSEKYLPNFMTTFQQCKRVVITYAPPGWPGHHHVNCQEYTYWVQKFDEYGFDFDMTETQNIRGHSTMQKPFMQNRGLFFVRRNSQ